MASSSSVDWSALSPSEVLVGAEAIFPAMEAEPLGDWMLRFTPGLDGTYSSTRVSASHVDDLDARLELVKQWYAGRAAYPVLQLSSNSSLPGKLEARGWVKGHSGFVMCGDVQAVLSKLNSTACSPEVMVNLETSSPRSIKARATLDGVVVGSAECLTFQVGPGNMDVAGLRSIETLESKRRQGIGSALVRTCLEWAQSQHATSVLLLVLAENLTAIDWYKNLGLAVHHEYEFWTFLN